MYAKLYAFIVKNKIWLILLGVLFQIIKYYVWWLFQLYKYYIAYVNIWLYITWYALSLPQSYVKFTSCHIEDKQWVIVL